MIMKYDEEILDDSNLMDSQIMVRESAACGLILQRARHLRRPSGISELA